MFSIGEFARLANVSPRTLRYYEEIGLLAPAAVDAATGYRSYSAYQLSRVHRIVALKDLGLSLEQLRPLLDDLSAGQLEGMLRLKRAELRASVAADQARLARVEHRLRHIESENEMPTDIVVKHVPDLHVAEIRCDTTGVDFDSVWSLIADAFRDLPQRLRDAGVRMHGPVFTYYDQQPDGTVVPHVAVDVGDQAVPAGTAVVEALLAATDVVSTVVHGPTGHGDIAPVYGQLARWAEDHGYRAAGPGRDSIVSTGESTEAVVELQLPVTKSGA